MEDLREEIGTLLREVAARFRENDIPAIYSSQLNQLAEEVYQRCVVAVVGQVNAGKSSFINALLKADLARVGPTETTATINHFLYGEISDQHPGRCFWRNGTSEIIDLEFLNSLQGDSLEVLQRSNGIDHLEYHVLNPYLNQVTLVDTPGTGTSVAEHRDRTAEFMHLERQLRLRRNDETQTIGSRADAVIYLIASYVKATEQDFLDDFLQVTSENTRALNVIGVLAKVDQNPAMLKDRQRLADKIATQLKGQLNTVVPISASLQRALDQLLADDKAGLKALMEAMRRLPKADVQKLLMSEKLYNTPDDKRTLFPVSERKALRENLPWMPWMVFMTIAKSVADPEKDLATVINELYDMAGFAQLEQVLEVHFFRRSRFLRNYRILKAAQDVIRTVKTRYVNHLRNKEERSRQQEGRYLAFIRQANGDPFIARELELLVKNHLTGRVQQVEELITEVEGTIENMIEQLVQHNLDFEALQSVLTQSNLFAAELEELKRLLGFYELEMKKRLPPQEFLQEHIENRQMYWRMVQDMDENRIRRVVAGQAVARYGYLLVSLAL